MGVVPIIPMKTKWKKRKICYGDWTARNGEPTKAGWLIRSFSAVGSR
jgi:hypothetical protein